MDIAVIGAGITGMSAAYDLARAGHRVHLFERSDAVGGLAAGFPTHGTFLERAYHHLFTTDTDIIGLAEELGVGKKLLWHDSSIAIFTADGKVYPFTGPIDLLRFKPLSFLNRLRLGITVLYIQKLKNWKKLVDIPVHVWLRRWCGEQSYNVIWKPLLIGKFHHFHERISMAWLWARLHIRANSRGPNDTKKEKLGYFDGGFQTLIAALRSELDKHNVTLALNASIHSIRHEVDSRKNVLRMENGEELKFDRVICTAPSHVFANLIENDPTADEKYLQRLRSIEYVGALCLVFSSRQNLSKYYWHNIVDVTSPFLVFIQHTNLIEKERYEGEHFYYLGAYLPHDHDFFRDDPENIRSIFFKHLKILLPSFDVSQITEWHLFTARNAQHIASCDYLEKIPPHTTPLRGVYLSNFSQVFPQDRGTNYAVRDGRSIAKMCMEEIK